MTKAQLIEPYIEKAQDSDFEISKVRKELEQKKISEEEIRIIVRLVDNNIQRNILNSASNDKSKELMLLGIVLTVVGAGITIATYIGLVDMGDSFFIAYGPFFTGLVVFFWAYINYKK